MPLLDEVKIISVPPAEDWEQFLSWLEETFGPYFSANNCNRPPAFSYDKTNHIVLVEHRGLITDVPVPEQHRKRFKQ